MRFVSRSLVEEKTHPQTLFKLQDLGVAVLDVLECLLGLSSLVGSQELLREDGALVVLKGLFHLLWRGLRLNWETNGSEKRNREGPRSMSCSPIRYCLSILCLNLALHRVCTS